MGNTASTTSYICEVEKGSGKEYSGVFRAVSHPEELVEYLPGRQDITNCWLLLKEGIRKSGRQSPALGQRVRLGDNSLGPYKWMSFGQLELDALSFGTALLDRGYVPMLSFPDEAYVPARSLRTMGILAKNCREWIVAESGCNAYGISIVPLYDSLGEEPIDYIIRTCKIETIISGIDCIETLLSVSKMKDNTLKRIIVIGDASEIHQTSAKKAKIELLTFQSVTSTKTKPPENVAANTVNTLCFTSGTTGTPKGVILTHQQFITVVAAALRGPLRDQAIAITKDDVHISYLPLPHVFERLFVTVALFSGAKVGFYSGDILQLLDDVQTLQPTFFLSVPRFYMRINSRIEKTMAEKSNIVSFLYHAGMKSKINKIRAGKGTTHAIWDRLIFSKVAKLLGGNVRFMVTGGAPLDGAIQEKMQALFCVPLLEGYGLTETMGGSFLRGVNDPLVGTVGGPIPCLDCKLRTVEDMGYRVTDNPPRGELLIRGVPVTPGYFLNPQATKEAFDGKWFCTGDVVVWLETGSLKIIDRKKAIFKLSQGEYVAPEKIEGVYSRAAMIGQIFVHGDSYESYLVAVVVLNEEQAVDWWAKNRKSSKFSLQEAQEDLKFYDVVKNSMTSVEKELKGFEKVRAFVYAKDAFTPENGLLTPTFKLKRNIAFKEYEEMLKDLYKKTNATIAAKP